MVLSMPIPSISIAMVKHWDALVMNDYEAVMPLPHRKKLSIHYLYQPFLTPVLGVFGKNISEQLVCNFLEAIPEFFKLWDISLNQSNLIPKKFQLQVKKTTTYFHLPASLMRASKILTLIIFEEILQKQ